MTIEYNGSRHCQQYILMRSLFITALLPFLFHISTGSLVSGQEKPDGSKTMRERNLQDNERTSTVRRGEWGGVGVRLHVTRDSAVFEFDCASASIGSTLRYGRGGKIRYEGTYLREIPGPIRRGFSPKPVPVIFDGKVSGDVLSLRITNKETGNLIGDYSVKYDNPPKIRKCR
jgi:hypothetical protein